MAAKRSRKDVDIEIDLHGLSSEDLRSTLQQGWPAWRNANAVRFVHGQGTVLGPGIIRWCEEMGIVYQPDSRNAGALRIFPRERTLPNAKLENTLGESGLRLTPEHKAIFRDPALVHRALQEERQHRLAEESRRRAQEANAAADRRRDEALWQAEMARLGVLTKKKRDDDDQSKPKAPIVLSPVEIKYQEGYWKAELSRVADTDTETLQVQKKTGLDRLAPPMREEPSAAPPASRTEPRVPKRDVEAEKALFEAEMQRLSVETS